LIFKKASNEPKDANNEFITNLKNDVKYQSKYLYHRLANLSTNSPVLINIEPTVLQEKANNNDASLNAVINKVLDNSRTL